MKNTFLPLLVLTMTLVSGLSGCKKFVDIGSPYTSMSTENVYADNSTAANVLSGIYRNVIQGEDLAFNFTTYLGVYADEMNFYAPGRGQEQYYYNALVMNLSVRSSSPFWQPLYNQIYRANAAIEGLGASKTLTDTVKSRLMGEAYFLRGFFYFYLVNLFGDVPVVLNSDYRTSRLLPRTGVDSVYDQIIADLTKAEDLLGDQYVGGDAQTVTTERLRPNKATATAMLARAYLYNRQYDKAAASAGSVIGQSGVYALDTLGGVFLKGSHESIWQLQPMSTGLNTPDGQRFILPAAGVSDAFPYALSHFLLDSFYVDDLRWQKWVGAVTVGGTTYTYPYKYKVGTFDENVRSTAQMSEFEVVIRLAEMHLIRAEALLLGSDDVGGCEADLNLIRHRAGLPDYAGLTDKESLMTELLRQRQIEFFAEWGHRWLDIKRTGRANKIMSVVAPAKGGSWAPYKMLFPLWLDDVNLNPNLKQNPEY